MKKNQPFSSVNALDDVIEYVRVEIYKHINEMVEDNSSDDNDDHLDLNKNNEDEPTNNKERDDDDGSYVGVEDDNDTDDEHDKILTLILSIKSLLKNYQSKITILND